MLRPINLQREKAYLALSVISEAPANDQLVFWFGALAEGVHEQSPKFSVRERKRKRKELGSQSPGVSQIAPFKSLLQSPLICESPLKDQVFSTWAFEGQFWRKLQEALLNLNQYRISL